MRFNDFKSLLKAEYISRPNRFIARCKLNGNVIRAYLPNPGRLWELLLPGTVVYLQKSSENEKRKTDYTLIGTVKKGDLVLLHTHYTNFVVKRLIQEKKVPGFEDYDLIGQEVTRGRSRFDFLLGNDKKQILLEVKSCTLFGEKNAMFPDAVSERAKRHITELSHLSKGNTRGAVLFLVHSPSVETFMPEYHTDLEFSRALYALRNKIIVKAVKVGWKKDFTLIEGIEEIKIPWKTIKQNLEDKGAYIIVLKLNKNTDIEIGGLGKIQFKKGYYLYVGSALKDLTKRIERHKRLRKNLFWHIDYLRNRAEFITDIPIRSNEDLECKIACDLFKNGLKGIDAFGASDCQCRSHLFYSEKDPLLRSTFIDLLQYYRIDRLQWQN